MVGAVLVLSIYWASRTGNLDMDLILAALFREEVTLCSDLLFGLGDIAAFTVSLFTAVWDDRDLQVRRKSHFIQPNSTAGRHSGQRARKRPAGSGRAPPCPPPAAALRQPH